MKSGLAFQLLYAIAEDSTNASLCFRFPDHRACGGGAWLRWHCGCGCWYREDPVFRVPCDLPGQPDHGPPQRSLICGREIPDLPNPFEITITHGGPSSPPFLFPGSCMEPEPGGKK